MTRHPNPSLAAFCGASVLTASTMAAETPATGRAGLALDAGRPSSSMRCFLCRSGASRSSGGSFGAGSVRWGTFPTCLQTRHVGNVPHRTDPLPNLRDGAKIRRLQLKFAWPEALDLQLFLEDAPCDAFVSCSALCASPWF